MNELNKESQNNLSTNSKPSNLSTLSNLNAVDRQKPNLLRINADNQDKKFMCIFWSIFLVFVIVLAITSKTLPKAIKPISNDTELAGTSLQGCQNPSTFQNNILTCTNFSPSSPQISIVTKQLSSLNQFVTFWIEIYPKDLVTPLTLDQNITYLLYGLQRVQNTFQKGEIYQNETVAFQYTSLSTNYIYADDKNKNIVGYKIFVGFIGQFFIICEFRQFPSNNLLLTIEFTGAFQQFTPINTISLQAYKISKSFTTFTIVLRYVFFVLSILAAFLYNRNYRKIPINDRIIQQKLIQILSVLLIFFNDPFYPVTVLKQNMVSSFFSMLFVLCFVVYLLFMWVIFFDRILYQQGQKQTRQITKFKIIYAIVLLILLMVLYMFYAYYRLNNHPLVPTQKLTQKSILILDILASISFIAVIIYITFQYIRICCDKTDRLWRSDLMLSYSILFIAAMVVFIFTNQSFGSYQYNGTTFIFLYGLMNLYTWYLQYMYSPSKQAVDEQINGEKRSLNSEQLMSVGTVEFNDLNINLDDGEEWRGLRDDNRNIDQKVHHKEQQNSHEQQQAFSTKISQQKHHKQQQQQIDFFNQQNINQYNNIIIQPNKTIQPNQTNLLQLSSSSSNHQHPATNKNHHQQHITIPQHQLNLQQLDQGMFEILSETVSQQPEENQQEKDDINIDHHYQANLVESDKQQEQKINKNQEGFGNFQLD